VYQFAAFGQSTVRKHWEGWQWGSTTQTGISFEMVGVLILGQRRATENLQVSTSALLILEPQGCHFAVVNRGKAVLPAIAKPSLGTPSSPLSAPSSWRWGSEGPATLSSSWGLAQRGSRKLMARSTPNEAESVFQNPGMEPGVVLGLPSLGEGRLHPERLSTSAIQPLVNQPSGGDE